MSAGHIRSQESILSEILDYQRDIDRFQENINRLVALNKELIEIDGFEDGYSESINSYKI